MICKQCGARLEATDVSCPVCGAPVAQRAGGVGFWDLVDGGRGAAPAGAQGAVQATPRATVVPQTDPRVVAQLNNQTKQLASQAKQLEALQRKLRLSMVVSLASLAVVVGLSAYALATSWSRTELEAQTTDLATRVGKLEADLERLTYAQATLQPEDGADSQAPGGTETGAMPDATETTVVTEGYGTPLDNPYAASRRPESVERLSLVGGVRR